MHYTLTFQDNRRGRRTVVSATDGWEPGRVSVDLVLYAFGRYNREWTLIEVIGDDEARVADIIAHWIALQLSDV